MSDPTERAQPLAHAITQWPWIRKRIAGQPLLICFDYDGTLTPIVSRPELARLAPATRAGLSALGALAPVAIVSGRQLTDLRAKVDLDTLYYAGNHGFEIWDPECAATVLRKGEQALSGLDRLHETLEALCATYPGIRLEHKEFSLSIHYRDVDEAIAAAFARRLDTLLVEYGQLERHDGKQVFEVRPRLDWHKGRAMEWLRDRVADSRASARKPLPIFVGDDRTDEDAFRTIKSCGEGLGVLVGQVAWKTSAEFALHDSGEVVEFISLLMRELQRVHT